MEDSDQKSSTSSRSPNKKSKKLKLSVVKKPKFKAKAKKDYIESDDDFVNPSPGPSKCKSNASNKKQLLTDAELKKQQNRERLAIWRANRSSAKKEIDRKQNTKRENARRANETPNQKQKRAKMDAERKATKRAAETADQHQIRIGEQRERQAQLRANETAEEHAERIRKRAETRANRTQEQQLEERSAARARMAAVRNYTTAGAMDATRSEEILQGTFEVLKLEDTVDTIGTMSVACNFCGAMKFPKEKSRTTICCSDGKVPLDPFPKPPEALMNLWMGSDAKSRLFKAHARQLNNAVCLSSLQVKERDPGGFNPSVVFQGRVHNRAGALLPADGEQPVCAQLYVYDSELESIQRYQNLRIPSNTSPAQKGVLRKLLQIAQDNIHEHNPYVRDFKQIIEMSDEEIGEGKIVISVEGPRNEHVRRYNAQTNLNEVCILMNPGKHDLVLQRRGGGLKYISALNPSGMPMHFTLLFPYGTHGWDEKARQAAGNRRITTREFYAFHLNIRQCDNGNYLHTARRLFQE